MLLGLTLAPDEKLQLPHRCAPELVRHVLAPFRRQQLSLAEALEQLQLGKSRFYELDSDYLRAGAQHPEPHWSPQPSGGDHAPPWPEAVTPLLRKRLSSEPPASYSFAASEVLRRCDSVLPRAQVRRWAHENKLAYDSATPHPPAPIRRWQRSQIGELWQLAASPHRYLPSSKIQWPRLNRLDDCRRLFTGSKLDERERWLSYLDLLPPAFVEDGRPLQLYVAYHSLFFTSVPACFASEPITTLEAANPQINALRRPRNQKEQHRELNLTPQAAWNRAPKEQRSVLRPVPRRPWWPCVWSVRTPLKVGSDGRVPIGSQRLRRAAAPGPKVVRCLPPPGPHSVRQHEPETGTAPRLRFPNRP